jgi:hypothetical protein
MANLEANETLGELEYLLQERQAERVRAEQLFYGYQDEDPDDDDDDDDL